MPERIAYAADHVLHTADFARFGFVAGIVEVVEAGLILLLYLVFVLFAQSGDLGDDLRIVLVELAGSGDFRSSVAPLLMAFVLSALSSSSL